MSRKLLIIGKIPPPIGGVTIHVQRLLQSLSKDDFTFVFQYLEKGNLWNVFRSIVSCKIIHIHSSSVYARFILVVLGALFFKTTIVTIHGDLNRYGRFKNRLDRITLSICTAPVVINEGSFSLSKRWNGNTKFIAAFIPPVEIKQLKPNLLQELQLFKESYENLYCTNAFNVTFDKFEKEIYGISSLMPLFESRPSIGLVFSDPSGKYLEYLKDKNIVIPKNVYIISKPHDFISVIKLSDGFIRATTTDGDSLSVKEALYYEKVVIASDCVSRPKECKLYKTNDFEDLQKVLSSDPSLVKNNESIVNGYDGILSLYKEYGLT